jgi:signal transduction histidine kinase/ligand-binding sensor domain-containing protein
MRCASRNSKFQFFARLAGIFLLIFSAWSARAELLPIKSYTSADGLIYESVIRIYQDSQGFVWFTTPVGISRFDGYQFTNYGMPEGLFDSLMTDMVEDNNGIYWFGTMRGIVYRFDPRASGERENQTGQPPKRFEDLKIPGEPFINKIYKTADGSVYIGTQKGLYLLDDARAGDDKLIPVKIDENKDEINIVWLAEDAGGSLWISGQNGLTRRLADGTLIRYEVQPADGKDLVRSFTIDAKNQIWLVTENRHLIVFNPEPAGAINKSDKSLRKLRFSPENKSGAGLAQGFAYQFTAEEAPADGSFSTPTATSDGKIWFIAVRKGVGSFDGREFRLYTKANGLRNNAASALMEDSFGNLWIGSDWGAMKLSRKGFVSYNTDDGLGLEPIANIFSDRRRGTLYAANTDWIVNRFDGRKFTAVKLNIPELPDNWLARKTLLDSTGDWWFATKNGLYRYSAIESLEQINQRPPTSIYKTEQGLPDNNIFGVFEDSSADVWISSGGARGDFLTRWNRQTGAFQTFTKDNGIPENCYARHFREDAAGNLYFSCSAENVLIFQQGKFTAYATENLPKGWWIGDIHVDRKGRLWVASPTRGLLKIENLASGAPTERLYSTADGLSSIHVQFITEDAAGKIYFVTSRGMDVLEPDSGKVKQYTLADGLAAAGTGVGWRDGNGDIWLGVSRGLSRFTPEIDRPLVPPPVFIGAVRIAGKAQPISALGETEIAGLTLEPDQSNLQIDFYGLNLTSGDALRYQYKLEGADDDWITLPPEQRSVNLSRAAGNYKFLVRAVTLEGSMSVVPASVSFTILRPVWQRRWFLLLLALFVVGLIYLLYRYRLQKLLELEKVRTRIATDLHDDIGASLSKIAILSEVVHQRIAPVAPADAEINEPLEEIAGTSRELVDSMSDIVWAINPERDHLSDLIQRMRNLAGELTEFADIGLRVHLSGIEADANLPLGADLRREIYLIFKETINNLVRHSASEMAEVSFAVENDNLVITVKDDGQGFSTVTNGNGANGATRGGNGLPNMKRRAANLGGSYEIASEVGRGTTAVLRVPLQTRFGQGFSLKNLYRKK